MHKKIDFAVKARNDDESEQGTVLHIGNLEEAAATAGEKLIPVFLKTYELTVLFTGNNETNWHDPGTKKLKTDIS